MIRASWRSGAAWLGVLWLPVALGCGGDGGATSSARTGALEIDVAIPGETAAAKPARETAIEGVVAVSSSALPADVVRRVPVAGGRVTATVAELPAGRADVSVDVLASDATVLWRGAAPAFVAAGTTVRASVALQPVDDLPPTVALECEPPAGSSQTVFALRAHASDRHEADEVLQVRWDFDGDGAFDTGWTSTKTATHRFAAPGRYRAAVQVRDSSGHLGAATAEVFVANAAPRAAAQVTIVRDDPAVVLLDGRGSSDPDGDALQYSWTQTGGGAVRLEGADQAVCRFAVAEPGVLAFALVVADGELASEPLPVVVVIPQEEPAPGANRTPIAVVADVDAVRLGDTAWLDGSASWDPDGDLLSFRWTQTAGPTVSLTEAATARPHFVAAAAGEYVFALEVSDGSAASEAAIVRVRVLPANRPPVASATAPTEVLVGTPFVLDGSASFDPDGDALRFSWTQLAGPAALELAAGEPTARVTAGQAGGYTFALTVTDSQGAAAVAWVMVRVLAAVGGPPAGARILFSAAFAGGPALYVAPLAGGGAVPLTSPADGGDLDPDCAPDGRIAFASFRAGRVDPFRGAPAAEIYVMAADGSNVARLTDNFWPERSPSWAPDGQRLAFARGRSVDAWGDLVMDICVVFANGSGLLELTADTEASSFAPDWSPDGTRLVYCALAGLDERGGRQSVVMRMDADGSHRVRLTEAYRRDVDPAWSPTGERIAFASDREGTYDVFVMNPDGTGVVNVTASPASNDREPSWGPDGQWLAFVSDRTGVDEIFVMAQPGDVPQRLLEAFGGASGPVWMPLARAPARLQAPSR